MPFAAGVLLLRRPPVVLLLQKLVGLRPREAVFAGWLGPKCVSAVFYLVLAEHEGVADPWLFAAGTLAVAVSTPRARHQRRPGATPLRPPGKTRAARTN